MTKGADQSSEHQPLYPYGIPHPVWCRDGVYGIPGAQVVDFTSAVEAIAVSLRRPVRFLDDQGYEQAIIAGTIHPQRQWPAWVEYKCKRLADYVDIEFRLKARVGDRISINWVVESYNPYFGCHVGYMAWHGERVIIIYREKHHSYAASLALDNSVTRVQIADKWLVEQDQITTGIVEPDLVERFSLPELQRLAPLSAEEARSKGLLPPGSEEAHQITRRIQAELTRLQTELTRRTRPRSPWWRIW